MLAKLFDRIGSAITSLGAVIFALLMTTTGMVFFSHTLFRNVFPSTMEPWEKLLATWVMALAWEFTVLITTCNTKHLNRHIPLAMAVASGIIVLFFIQAFDSSLTGLQIIQRWFVGILAATINYIYADLFYAKWQERSSTLAMPVKLVELQHEVNEYRSRLIDLQSKFDQVQSTRDELQREVGDLRSFRKKIDQELTCPHCKEQQPSYGTLHAHKGHCHRNPKNSK